MISQIEFKYLKEERTNITISWMFFRNDALQLAINYTPHHVADYTLITDEFKSGTLKAIKKSLCDAVRTEY